MPPVRQANFYDISCILNPDYDLYGYITKDMGTNLAIRINAYVQAENLALGDVLFVGDAYQTRQEYGFYMVTDQGKAQSAEGVIYLPNTDKRLLGRLQAEHVNYTDLFQRMTDDRVFQFMFFPDDEDEKTDIINTYRQNKLL
jgi:hypothetical protein